jgi:hypothetical protein
MATSLWMRSAKGKLYRVWEVREYRTYAPGYFDQTRWARILLGGNPIATDGTRIRGRKNWVLEPLSSLVVREDEAVCRG